MAIEGIDYSRGGPLTSADLKNAGKVFVGRYAVNDKTPNGRGITADEYAELAAGGIDVFLYWEANEAWMLGGWQAGVSAARNAMANVAAAGMPEGMPVYYSHDIEPDPQHYAAIDDCLRGAASVVGPGRVALYGGYGIVEHCAAVGTAEWFCQTYAWEYGRGIHPAAHLYQYDNYGNLIAGVDVDLVRAVKAHYGQAGDFVKPAFPPKRSAAPDTMSHQGFDVTRNEKPRWLCTQGGRLKTYPDLQAPDVAVYSANRTYTFEYGAVVGGAQWLLSRGGSWAPAKNFVPK